MLLIESLPISVLGWLFIFLGPMLYAKRTSGTDYHVTSFFRQLILIDKSIEKEHFHLPPCPKFIFPFPSLYIIGLIYVLIIA